MRDIRSFSVHLVTDRLLSRGRPFLEIVEAAVKAGVSVVQLREKELSTRDFYNEGLAVKRLLKGHDVAFIINDRVDVAMALDADGAHLGQTDMPVEVARDLMGPGKIIGLSVETMEHVSDEAVKYADYLGVSPIFVTSTKPELEKAWGLEGLKRVRSATDMPLVAIGSINANNADAVIEAGADNVAVVSAITSADDPNAAAREIVEKVQAAKAKKAV